MFIHTFEIHSPYCSPPPEGTRFADADGGLINCLDELEITTPELGAHASDLYDGSIYFTDDVLAGFLKKLRRRGFLDNTAIVITADHGEEFGEHDHYGHTTHIYPEIVHVPLLFRLPGAQAGGKRIDRLVSTRDLHATLADIMGIPKDKQYARAQSLLPMILGDENDTYDRPAVYSHLPNRSDTIANRQEMNYEFDNYAIWRSGARYMISNRDWLRQAVGHVPKNPDTPEWTEYGYDHASDPREQKNIADTPTEELKQLKAQLMQRLLEDGQLRHSLGSRDEDQTQSDADETLEEMEALGYF